MSEEPDFKEVLKRNRMIILAVLMLPVVGMVIAIPLIAIRAPKNFALATGLIVLMIFQYVVLALYVSRRMDRLISS
jgi:uncharacterized protein involved in response to NO